MNRDASGQFRRAQPRAKKAYEPERAKRGTTVVLLYGERYESADPVVAAREAVVDIVHYAARDLGGPTARGILRAALKSLDEAPSTFGEFTSTPADAMLAEREKGGAS